jgi:hypothetical protein
MALSSTRAIKKLGKDVAKLKDDFDEGTVIRWLSVTSDDKTYTYVVVKAAGKWWITGTALWYGKQIFTYEELVGILSRSDVATVEVAIEWAGVNR